VTTRLINIYMTDQTKKPFQFQRPSGKIFPDYSVVISEKVMASIKDTLDHLRLAKRWHGISTQEDALHQIVLRFFLGHGHAPTIDELSQISKQSIGVINMLLDQLCQRDLIVLEGTGDITGAYPFTDKVSEHRITIDNVDNHAMCAIDALGAGAMANNNSHIQSSCRQCGCEITIKTDDKGRHIKTVKPTPSIVWSGVQDIDGCAADSQCTVMAFFCSDEHLSMWREKTSPKPMGHRLSMDEGLQAGRALFQPFLG